MKETLRVIVYQDEGEVWHTQGLEYDISAHTERYQDLGSLFKATLDAEASISYELNGKAFSGIPSAPKVFYKLWDNKAVDDPTLDAFTFRSTEVDFELQIEHRILR